jgi:serine/threonine protein kinase
MLATGTEIGGYRIEGILGRGGMGVVYEATQLSLGRTVALKILEAGLSADPGFRDRFRREGRIQASLHHGHIVTVHEAGESDAGLFIAMALIRGPTLKELIRGEEMDPARTLRILTPVADALDAAHESGLIHRDVKPQNILVGRRDHGYLADFGITKGINDTGFTQTGHMLGTLLYMAPELIRGERPTPASDVYAFAAVVYECLVGREPFRHESEAAVLYAHVAEPVPPPTSRAPALPPEVDDVVVRGLAKNPAERPATALELMQDLQELFPAPPRRTTSEQLQAVPPPEPATEAAPPAPAPVEPPEPEPVDPQAATQHEPARGTPTLADARRRAPLVPPERPTPAPEPRADAEPRPEPEPEPEPEAEPPARESHVAPEPEPKRRESHAEPEPEPARDPRPSARPKARAGAVLAAGLLAAIGAGAAIGSVAGGGDGAPPTHPPAASAKARTLRGGPIAVTVPAAWRTVDAPTVSGLEFAGRPVAARAPDGDATVVAGIVDGRGPTLLPAAFRDRLSAVPDPAPVRLAHVEAYRYSVPRAQGTAGLVRHLYAAPTSRGVVVVGCSGTVPAGTCATVADSLTVADGVQAYDLGPRAAYAKAAGRVITRLRRDRASGLRRLRSARTPDGQASGSAAVAQAYGRAADGLRFKPAPLEADAHAVMAASFRRASTAYARLAAAARAGRRSTYAARRTRAARADQAARAAVAALARLGYRTG